MGASIPCCGLNEGLGNCHCEECDKFLTRSDAFDIVLKHISRNGASVTRMSEISFRLEKDGLYRCEPTSENTNIVKNCLVISKEMFIECYKRWILEDCEQCEVGNPCLYCKHTFEQADNVT